MRINLIIWILGLLVTVGARSDNHVVHHISLPAQSVAESLVDLSEQLDVALIFPYTVARELNAKSVNGLYTLPEVLEVLFEGTDFQGGLSKDGVLIILYPGIDTKRNQIQSKKSLR